MDRSFVTIVTTAQSIQSGQGRFVDDGDHFGRQMKVDSHLRGPWSEECRFRRLCALSKTDTLDQAQLYFSLVAGVERQLDGVKIWCILVAVGMKACWMIPASNNTATVEQCWKEVKCKLPVLLECESWLRDTSCPEICFLLISLLVPCIVTSAFGSPLPFALSRPNSRA